MISLQRLFAAILCMLAFGCGDNLMRPDSVDTSKLADWFRGLTESERAAAKKWSANRSAAEDLGHHDSEEEVMRVDCSEDTEAPQVFDRHYVFTVGDVLSCLRRNAGALDGNFTYEDCLHDLMGHAEDDYRAAEGTTTYDCVPTFAAGYGSGAKPAIPPRWDPNEVADDDVTSDLVASKSVPAWLLAIGGATLLSALPTLCVLGIGWACTGSYPGASGGSTSGGSP